MITRASEGATVEALFSFQNAALVSRDSGGFGYF